ncbi:unnamed protein product [Victoria cruziana]
MAPSQTIATILFVVSMAAAASAATYTVGDSSGWSIPSSPNFYDTWAASKTFHVNDKLVFNFPTGAHTAVQVSETDYKACTFTNPIETYGTGPATVTLNGPGAHYYLCSIPGHCAAGQKVTINVVSAASSPPPSKATPSPVARPPIPFATPPASSAPSPSPIARPPLPVTTPPASHAPSPFAVPPTSFAPSPSSPPFVSPSGSPLPSTGTPSSSAGTPGTVSTPSSLPPASAASFSRGFKWATFLALVLAFTFVW